MNISKYNDEKNRLIEFRYVAAAMLSKAMVLDEVSDICEAFCTFIANRYIAVIC
ncbi:hypothetical protein NIES3585_02870 [Nodularia sp. NIES-3585]|nr:hypothetical protein NIES3585_02870 [Nodularia sp. NIES-3585]